MVAGFREIVELWPSHADMAVDVGAPVTTVRKWSQRNSIPAEWWASLLRTENARTNGITSELLTDLAARAPAAPAEPSEAHA